ncbi:ATP-binding protein [Paraflavitalea sp. CAU 1676]|uniref:ATP-binding protein n=1 Tax=Paraflavitalea sp. CAU 1676 TaxID=3032598 RepID=UPI0023D978D3|nr:ATP-binding protein [Paraflavitalea sp. CAU 1676]MDF2191380.1 ATP-binding protein [Paraflavitalea sp. CAU 1676]
MTPSQLHDYLVFAIHNNFPVLITGAPGIGKSDIVEQAANSVNHHLILSHPVVSDPTDYKGLPFPTDSGIAEFLPYGDLHALLIAEKPTAFFLDDLGQATPAVQAACMQLLLARQINGHKISEHVKFIAATNRRQDKAGVSGMLEPVKSRFKSIVELKVNVDDWVQWALRNNMPPELIAFVKFRPHHLEAFVASKDFTNSPSPRTIAAIGVQQNANLDKELEAEVFTGAAGEAFAAEYISFLKHFRELPSVEDVISNPKTTTIPNSPSAQFAIATALSRKISDVTITPIIDYIGRLAPEISIACLVEASQRNKAISNNTAFIQWASKNTALFA